MSRQAVAKPSLPFRMRASGCARPACAWAKASTRHHWPDDTFGKRSDRRRWCQLARGRLLELLIGEVQLRRDRRKHISWPIYLTVARAEVGLD